MTSLYFDECRLAHPMTALRFPTELPPGSGKAAERFRLAMSSLFDKTRIKFEIAVPVAWRILDQLADPSLAFRTIEYVDPLQSATIKVQLTNQYRDVNPADWLSIAWDSAGGEVLHRRESSTPGGAVCDLLVRHVDKKGTSIWRSMIHKDGSRLFRVEARADEDLYANHAEDLFVSLSSFRLLHPENKPTAESLHDASFSLPVPLTFQRLESWTVEPAIVDPDRCVLHLTSQHEGVEVGRITVEIRRPVENRSLNQLAIAFSEQLKSSGFRLGGAPILPITPPKRFQAAAVYQPTAQFEGDKLDSPVLLYQHEEAQILLALLGPSRETSPEWWAINKRAFEIVRDSLRIGEPESAAEA